MWSHSLYTQVRRTNNEKSMWSPVFLLFVLLDLGGVFSFFSCFLGGARLVFIFTSGSSSEEPSEPVREDINM